MKKNDIEFSELVYYNDSNSFVFLSLLIESEDDIHEIEKYLQEKEFLPKDKHIIGYHYICDNVIGKDGRSDYLFEVEPCSLNPIARLKLRMECMHISWTSDFVSNYANDYISKIY